MESSRRKKEKNKNRNYNELKEKRKQYKLQTSLFHFHDELKNTTCSGKNRKGSRTQSWLLVHAVNKASSCKERAHHLLEKKHWTRPGRTIIFLTLQLTGHKLLHPLPHPVISPSRLNCLLLYGVTAELPAFVFPTSSVLMVTEKTGKQDREGEITDCKLLTNQERIQERV